MTNHAHEQQLSPWWPPGFAGELLAAQPVDVIPVVGAGVSKQAGMPLGDELAHWLAAEMPAADGEEIASTIRNNPRTVADRIVGPADDPYAEARSVSLRKRVADYCTLERHDAAPGPMAHALVRIPSRLIVTLNYDLVIETAAEQAGLGSKSLTWRDAAEAATVLMAREVPSRLHVLHVHGSVAHPETIVLDHFGYAELDDSQIDAFWKTAIFGRRLCLLGLTLDEAYLVEKLRTDRGGARAHVMIVDATTDEAISVGRLSITREAHGIERVVLPDAPDGSVRYEAIGEFLTQLARRGKPIAAREIPELAPTIYYTPPSLVEHRGDEDEGVASLLAEWDFGGHRQFRRLFSGRQQFAESDVVLHDRTLIVGEPGSGKSELLLSIAASVQFGYDPVLIRLADVDARPGDPRLVLARWLAAGFGAAPPADADLPQAGLHLLLDAVDEVPAAHHAEVVNRIREIADVFPGHRFTVTTRPVDGLEGLAAGDWQILRIMPSQRWQHAYLRRRSLEWDRDIHPHLAGIDDAREILRLPFFLSRVVEMRDRDELSQQRDLWGLLQALVTDALEREEGHLLLTPEDARTWLRRVALAMLLVGRSTLSGKEIAQIQLPASVVGSHEEVCETLTLRLMLRPNGGSGDVGFTHRFFGACLAAEALQERGPTPELLDALVPQRSPEIRGARLDVLVPVSLVMSRDETWRQAVRATDPIAAARSTPQDASSAERASAARALWDRYVDWRVWIWGRHVPDLAEDSRSLGRLLAAADLADLKEEIEAAIDAPDRVLQGNAVAVLSHTGDRGIEPMLRRLIEDDERDTVVRREAASAARRLQLTGLLDAIVERAISSNDDVEVQDCSAVAMSLAPTDDLVSTANRLLDSSSDSAHIYALTRLQDRASPRQQIAVLANLAARDLDRYRRESEMLLDAVDKLESSDEEIAEDVGYAAAAWRIDEESVRALACRHRNAFAQGMGSAVRDERAFLLDVFALAELFSVEELVAAGWPREFTGKLTEARCAREARAALGPDPEIQDPSYDDPSEDEDPTLAELLERPRDEHTDWLITHNSNFFSRQAAELSEHLRRDLAARLDEWWPDEPFASTVTWRSRSGGGASWSMRNEAAGWVWYGPPLDKDLNAEQWAQIAGSGVVPFDEQLQWLQRHHSPQASERLAGLLTEDTGEFWYPALRAIPEEAELPDALIEALLTHLRDAKRHEIDYIAKRLATVGLAHVRRLAAISPEFAATVQPVLARRGDPDAVATMLATLERAVRKREWVDADDMDWLDGVGTDVRWLPRLFGLLRSAFTTPPPTRPGLGISSAVLSAIYRIGVRHPDEAVAGYDKLFEVDDECRWLRSSREEIVQTALAHEGVDAARRACAAEALPYLIAESVDG